MDSDKETIYRCLLTGKMRTIFGCPKFDKTSRMCSSLTYCRLRSFLHLPVVYADSPSATDIMEKRMEKKAVGMGIVTAEDVSAYLAKETGKDRLIQMFIKREDGHYGTEVSNIIWTLLNACGCAFIMSSVFSSWRAKEQFLEDHRSAVFKTKFRAERLMNDKIILAVMKDGAKWAFRFGAFLLPFLMVSQSIAVYRNKSTPLEYVAGSAVSGFLIKMNLGLKGGLAGGVIGGVMGLATGCVIYGLLYAGGELQEDRHFIEIQEKLELEKERERQFGKSTPVMLPEAS